MHPDQDVGGGRATGEARFVLRLDGCTPAPLASYLKALGILRLVAEQKDPSARGWWEHDVFCLDSDLDRKGLRKFLLTEYEPTPILAPWNGGSGFYPKDNRKAIEPLRDGSADRLSTLRKTIQDLERHVQKKGLEKRPDPGDAKRQFVSELRNSASDEFLTWLDAAIALSTEDLMYPPLLGTGGNDGRLDFTNNFMSNLVAVMSPDTGLPEPDSDSFLRQALFDDPVTGLNKSAIGQFSPGSAGGPNAETGYEGDSMINPWDFILMLEGAVVLASSTARRLESVGQGVLAFPFTVRSTGAGSGAAAIADEGSARAETWMPLWSRPCGFDELGHLLSEGRIVLDQRMSRDGLDAVRAMAKLGVDRGIDAFERFGYLQRSGLAYLATPMGRMNVSRNPEVDLIDELDRNGWLARFRRLARDDAPARLSRLVRQLESVIFDLSGDSGAADRLQRCLVVLGDCQHYLSASPRARQECGVPIPVLSEKWLHKADGGDPEFGIAACLAGLHGIQHADAEQGSRERRVLTMAEYMAPVDSARGRTRRWIDGGHNRVVWSGGVLDRDLGRVMSRRVLDQSMMNLKELPLFGDAHLPVDLVAEWLTRPAWDRRIAELLPGLALAGRTTTRAVPTARRGLQAPAAYCLLKPFFVPRGELQSAMPGGLGRPDPINLPSPAELIRLLRAEDPERALSWARTRLRGKGLVPPNTPPSPIGARSTRLLAALMVPIRRKDLNSILVRFFGMRDQPDPDRGNPTDISSDTAAGAPASITSDKDE